MRPYNERLPSMPRGRGGNQINRHHSSYSDTRICRENNVATPSASVAVPRTHQVGGIPTPASSIDFRSPAPPRRDIDHMPNLFGNRRERTVTEDFDSRGRPKRSQNPDAGVRQKSCESWEEVPSGACPKYSVPTEEFLTGDIDRDIAYDRDRGFFDSFRNQPQFQLHGMRNTGLHNKVHCSCGTSMPHASTCFGFALATAHQNIMKHELDNGRDHLSHEGVALQSFQVSRNGQSVQKMPLLHSQFRKRAQTGQVTSSQSQAPYTSPTGRPSLNVPPRSGARTGQHDAMTSSATGALQSVGRLPDKFRSIFSFPLFNAVQSQCFELAFHSDRNLVVGAPTGSGKTCIMELAILRLLSQPDGDNAKVVYMAPTKALCNERNQDWQKKFRVLGISCNELTGDTDNLRVNEIQQSNIIVTTPEKWDSMTRRWRDYKNLMGLLRLILIDECHILNEPIRGATLEVIVSRMKTVNIELQRDKTKHMPHFAQNMRFLALSATAPNIGDIAAWLKDSKGASAEIRVFGEEYRPIQLRKEVLSFFSNTSNYFQFESTLDYKLSEVIEKFSNNKPTLVFCSTRRSVTLAAERLFKQCTELVHATGICGPMHPFVKTRQQSEKLRDMQGKLAEKKLAQLVLHGIAYHNGGLTHDDRNLVESAFRDGFLSVICATSTLAVGVNLPAHLVIIKGTMQYNGTGYAPYSEFDITQMLGRAGRPQFDDSGTAVIMTDLANVHKYQDMVTGKQIIESSLHENLIEHLNSEVVLGSINSFESASEWLQSSFLYVRMRKNPAHYKLKNCSNVEGKLSAEKRLESICLRDLELLNTHGLVRLSEEQKTLETTAYGQSMMKYYIKFKTAVSVLQLQSKATLRDALETLCKAEEFSEIHFRGDKTQLNLLNKNKSIRFPLKGRVSSVDQKVNVLIQCCLGSISIADQKSHLALETTSIMTQATRVARFMTDVCHEKGNAIALMSTLELSRCCMAKTWENSPFLLKQIDSIGPSIARMLANAGISTFEKLEKTDPRHLEFTVNRNPPFGNKVLELASFFPRFSLEVAQFKELARPTEVELFINTGLSNRDVARIYGKRGQHYAAFIAATSNHNLVDYRRIPLKQLKDGESFRLRVKLTNPNERILCILMHEDFVGLDVRKEVVPDVKAIHFRNMRQAQISDPPTPAQSGRLTKDAPDQDDGYEDFGDDIMLDDSQIAALIANASETEHGALKPTPVEKIGQKDSHSARISLFSSGKHKGFEARRFISMLLSDEDDFPALPPPFMSDFGRQMEGGNPMLSEPVKTHESQSHGNLNAQNPAVLASSSSLARSSKRTQRLGSGRIGEGHVSCRHKCRDKQSCAHECCKTGVPLRNISKRKRSLVGDDHDTIADKNHKSYHNSSDQMMVTPVRPKKPEMSGLPSDKAYKRDGQEDLLTFRARISEAADTPVEISSPSAFFDLEAQSNGHQPDSSPLAEIEGEFDGWLVGDDEHIETTLSSDNDVHNKKCRVGKAGPLAEEGGESSDYNDSPLKKRRYKRRAIIEPDSSDSDNNQVPAKSLETLVRGSSFRQTSDRSESGPSFRGSSGNQRRPWTNSSFDFVKSTVPRGPQGELDALNRLHERTTSQNPLAPRSFQTSHLRQLSQIANTTPLDPQQKLGEHSRNNLAVTESFSKNTKPAVNTHSSSQSRAALSQWIRGLKVEDYAEPLCQSQPVSGATGGRFERSATSEAILSCQNNCETPDTPAKESFIADIGFSGNTVKDIFADLFYSDRAFT
ncbi:Sec63 Brl domain-containing protein [Powellomyces hirtus]|nr:Sec63 Brl domain-containing protein [Powellomyces hirtus]